ncbi:P-loop containing nucleoside triphosphate hydrolase protein [Cyathus striatus]|nr:P-loop containing nucleoside triphosphate hydrolase protein [Cyathus striatus]
MTSFFLTLTRFCHQQQCCRAWPPVKHARHISRSAVVYSDGISKNSHSDSPSRITFEDLGLHPPIIDSLRKAFPNVKSPTETQTQFIPAILSNKDVLLRDQTGSGKSFGLILALLNKPRLKSKFIKGKISREQRHITSLVLVPHRDLAYQLLHWIERMLLASQTGSAMSSLNSIAQVLVRDGSKHLSHGIQALQSDVPHILIGTPTAVMDIYKEDSSALQLSRLSSVVVDEVDYLIETLPKKDLSRTFMPAHRKSAQKIKAHPGETRLLLDIIYSGRKDVNQRRRDEPGLAQYQRTSVQQSSSTAYPPSPQLILSSATLRAGLKNYLFEESGWLNRDNLVKIRGQERPAQTSQTFSVPEKSVLVGEEDSANSSLGGQGIKHSVLLVSDNIIRNVAGAIEAKTENVEGQGEAITSESIFGASEPFEPENDIDPKLVAKFINTPSPFNPNALEAIATAFALDVPSIALLVLPSSSPVQRAVFELREMGVNACGLDLKAIDKGRSHLLKGTEMVEENPVLLVATLATTRGLDLPEMTHVFVLGMPEGPKVTGRSVDAYLHVAGRVGRFGRGGKVITILEEKDDIEKAVDEGEKKTVVTDASKMVRILNEIKVKPVRFEHFD